MKLFSWCFTFVVYTFEDPILDNGRVSSFKKVFCMLRRLSKEIVWNMSNAILDSDSYSFPTDSLIQFWMISRNYEDNPWVDKQFL